MNIIQIERKKTTREGGGGALEKPVEANPLVLPRRGTKKGRQKTGQKNAYQGKEN